MSYPRPNLTTLIQSVQNYLATAQLGNVGTVPLPNSALNVIGTSNAQLAYLLYGYLDYISLQSNPATCTGAYCDAWGNLKGVPRKLPTASSGLVSFLGTSGTVISSGTIVVTNDGTTFTTQANFTIGTTTTVAIDCNTTGSITNYLSGTSIALQTPIAGVTSASLSNAITGGTDLETDIAYQTRYLAYYADQPSGGSVNDFYNWAMAAPGVTRAFVYPNPAGSSNVVTIYCFMDITESAHNGQMQGTNGGATGDTRISTATGDQLTVANYIYPLRAATSIPYVAAPTLVPINFTINPLITASAATESAILVALQQMLLVKQNPLGMILYASDVYDAIASVSGISEFQTTFTDTTYTLGNVPSLGTVTFL